MKTYTVGIPRTVTQVIKVVATTQDEAIEKAYKETSVELIELIKEGRAFIADYFPAEGFEISVEEDKEKSE